MACECTGRVGALARLGASFDVSPSQAILLGLPVGGGDPVPAKWRAPQEMYLTRIVSSWRVASL